MHLFLEKNLHVWLRHFKIRYNFKVKKIKADPRGDKD